MDGLEHTTQLEQPNPETQQCLFEAAATEAHRHKWIESEKAGYDLGDRAIEAWYSEFWRGFCRECYIEHLGGKVFWTELDSGDFGLLKHQFHDNMKLVEQIVDIFKRGGENLDVVQFALSNDLNIQEVLDLLKVLDINARRIAPAVEISKHQFVEGIKSSHKARALIVDDVESTCMIIAGIIETTGIETVSVFTGEDALEEVQTKQFDLFIVDLLLPGKHGAEVAWYLKRHGVKAPIIAICSSLEMWSEDDLIDCGFTQILPKPVDAEALKHIAQKVYNEIENRR